MFYRDICKILGYYLLGLTATFIIPLSMAIYYEYWGEASLHPQPHTTLAFLESFLICFALSLIIYRIGRKSSGNIFRKEGFAFVVIIWFLTPALTALPFILSETLTNPFQAYFETTSGLTTTGSSVMQAKQYDPHTGIEVPIEVTVPGVIPTTYTFYGNVTPVRDPGTQEILLEGVEAVAKPLLFWRSFIQLLGGGGIVVLFVAILPALGVGGKILFQTEVSNLATESQTPRIKETALNLWKIYLGLTILQIIFLMTTNDKMPLFDAITISFATIATGGFSVKNASIGAYNNVNTEWVVIIFMILGSVNFSLYFYIIRGKLFRLKNPEFILYILILALVSGLSAWYLVGTEKKLLTTGIEGVFSVGEAIRYATFQIVSTQSTTGFATADFNGWPYAVQTLMLMVMYFGGMSGSTAGGIKVIRLFMLFRIAQYKVQSLFRPQYIHKFKIGDREVDVSVTTMVLCFFLVVISISAFSTLLYIMDGCDLETSIGLVGCMINCVGLAFRVAGPTESCAFLSDFGLALSSLLMILGRLEFFAVLVVLLPAFWKQKS